MAGCLWRLSALQSEVDLSLGNGVLDLRISSSNSCDQIQFRYTCVCVCVCVLCVCVCLCVHIALGYAQTDHRVTYNHDVHQLCATLLPNLISPREIGTYVHNWCCACCRATGCCGHLVHHQNHYPCAFNIHIMYTHIYIHTKSTILY